MLPFKAIYPTAVQFLNESSATMAGSLWQHGTTSLQQQFNKDKGIISLNHFLFFSLLVYSDTMIKKSLIFYKIFNSIFMSWVRAHWHQIFIIK